MKMLIVWVRMMQWLDLALCSDIQTTVNFSHLGLRLYNDVLCLRTKITLDDILTSYTTLTFLLVSTQFNLTYPTHWILTSADTIVDNRVYCIIYLALYSLRL